MLRVTIAAGGLLWTLASPLAYAQVPDYRGQLQPTLSANEQFVNEIRDAMPPEDLQAITQRSTAALLTGQQLDQQLDNALALAPDDASRSRVAGVLTHMQAAVASVEAVHTESTVDAARGRLEQARGEAVEGLNELRPVVLALPLPAELPVAGSLYGPEIAVLPLLGGILLILAGVALRRTSSVADYGQR